MKGFRSLIQFFPSVQGVLKDRPKESATIWNLSPASIERWFPTRKRKSG